MPGGPLNLNSTNLPRPWSGRESSPSGKIHSGNPPLQGKFTAGILPFRENSQRESSPSGKIPTVEAGIEPGTS